MLRSAPPPSSRDDVSRTSISCFSETGASSIVSKNVSRLGRDDRSPTTLARDTTDPNLGCRRRFASDAQERGPFDDPADSWNTDVCQESRRVRFNVLQYARDQHQLTNSSPARGLFRSSRTMPSSGSRVRGRDDSWTGFSVADCSDCIPRRGDCELALRQPAGGGVCAVRLRALGSHQHRCRLLRLALDQQFLSPAARCDDVTKGDVTLGGVSSSSSSSSSKRQQRRLPERARTTLPSGRIDREPPAAPVRRAPPVAINIPESSASL